jgi:aspartate racemase
MHTPSLGAYMEHIYRGDWPAVGNMMLASAEKLAGSGADFVICPDNTSPGAAVRRGALTAAVAAHRRLCPPTRAPRPRLRAASASPAPSGWSRARSTPEARRARARPTGGPHPGEREEINRHHHGRAGARASSSPNKSPIPGDRPLKSEGCDAVVLGCTEIPLIMNDQNSPLPNSIRPPAGPRRTQAGDRRRRQGGLILPTAGPPGPLIIVPWTAGFHPVTFHERTGCAAVQRRRA